MSSPDSSATSALASLCTLLQGSEQMIAQTLQTLQASQSEPESQDLSSFLGSIYEGLHGAHFSTLVFPNRIWMKMHYIVNVYIYIFIYSWVVFDC